jgi:zinc protease
MRLRTTFLALLTVGLLHAATGIFPYPYTQEDLPNGLRLVTIPTDFPNIVSLFIVVDTGSRNEVEPGKSGFAHLFEHLMFRGTAEFPTDRYQAELQGTGAASNAFTSADLTAFHNTFSKEDLPLILSMEADRFQHLAYEPAAFKTETLAVLGEFNKNSANPTSKLFDVLHATAFKVHPYKHTTMGFIEDIKAMPDEFDYSRQFFDRYYRPEHTTIVVVGDVDAKRVRSMVDERWGQWKRGSFNAQVPTEPPQDGPRAAHIDWPSSTLPWVSVAWRGPAYSDSDEETVALDAISEFGFGRTSPLYQKLVLNEQKADRISADSPFNVDPALFTVLARVKNAADLSAIQDQIVATAAGFDSTPVDAKKLEELKRHVRYEFALSLRDSEAIANSVARYIALRRTPETINRLYDAYAKLTPDDIQKAARKYLTEKNRTVVTLTSVTLTSGSAK